MVSSPSKRKAQKLRADHPPRFEADEPARLMCGRAYPCRNPTSGLRLLDSHGDETLAIARPHQHEHLLLAALRCGVELMLEGVDVLHVMTIELQDGVTNAQALFLSGAAGLDRRHRDA